MHPTKATLLLVVVSLAGSSTFSVSEDNTSRNSCFCTMDYRPVCGSDGRTYANQCYLGCEQSKNSGLQQACNHECPCEMTASGNSVQPQPTDCFCPKIYFPVCGSNGITYSNRCIFECAQRDNPDITLVVEEKC